MKIRVVWVGRTKSSAIAGICDDYASRIRHFVPFEIIEIKEPKSVAQRVEDEGRRILDSVANSDFVVVLDSLGKSWDSGRFSRFIGKHLSENPKNLVFVIGGFGGLSGEIKARADLIWSLSPLTFTHDLTRAVLLEQIYRAFAILHNLPFSR